MDSNFKRSVCWRSSPGSLLKTNITLIAWCREICRIRRFTSAYALHLKSNPPCVLTARFPCQSLYRSVVLPGDPYIGMTILNLQRHLPLLRLSAILTHRFDWIRNLKLQLRPFLSIIWEYHFSAAAISASLCWIIPYLSCLQHTHPEPKPCFERFLLENIHLSIRKDASFQPG